MGHEICEAVPQSAVQLGDQAGAGRTVEGRDRGTYRAADRGKSSCWLTPYGSTAPSHAQVWWRGGDKRRLSSRAWAAVYGESAERFAERSADDWPHARACGGDHRFAGHRNWREYGDLFVVSADPVATTASSEWRIEFSAG